MNLIVEFHPEVRLAARAVYRRSELALEYAREPTPAAPERSGIQANVDAALGITSPKWLAIADTLVMVFSGSDASLTAFDAYTNIDMWTRTTELATPEVVGGGTVRLSEPPSDTDRIDMGVVPSFQYSERQARLRIDFGRQRHGIRHYAVSDYLIVGIDDNGLATLELSNLRVE